MWISRASLAGLLLALIAPACAERPTPGAAAGAGAHTGAGAPSTGAVAGVLQFVADDAPAALAEAKRRGVPIFVEAWAPW